MFRLPIAGTAGRGSLAAHVYFGFRVWGLGLRVWGFGFRVLGIGFWRVWSSANRGARLGLVVSKGLLNLKVGLSE